MGHVFPALGTANEPLAILENAVAAGHLDAKSGIGLLEWLDGKG